MQRVFKEGDEIMRISDELLDFYASKYNNGTANLHMSFEAFVEKQELIRNLSLHQKRHLNRKGK